MAPPWVVRVASTNDVGLGHLARSTALACALARHVPVFVLLDDGTLHLHSRYARPGYVLREKGDWGQACAGVVLDGYTLVREEIGFWREKTPFLAEIEDFGTPPPLADFVIAPAPHLSGDRIGGTPAAAGGCYALLDSAFANALPERPKRPAPHVAAGFGAIDSQGATLLAIEALKALRGRLQLTATVMISSATIHFDAIDDQARTARPWLELAVDHPAPGQVWRNADLAIGAGGVSFLERLASGCPSVCIATSENQMLALSGTDDLGVGVYAGRVGEIGTAAVAGHCLALLEDPSTRLDMARRARELVDGQGAERAAAALIRQSGMKTDSIARSGAGSGTRP